MLESGEQDTVGSQNVVDFGLSLLYDVGVVKHGDEEPEYASCRVIRTCFERRTGDCGDHHVRYQAFRERHRSVELTISHRHLVEPELLDTFPETSRETLEVLAVVHSLSHFLEEARVELRKKESGKFQGALNRRTHVGFILVHLLGFGPPRGDRVWQPVQYGEGVDGVFERVHVLDECLEDMEQCAEIATVLVELFAVNEGEEGLGGVPFDAEVGVRGCLQNIGEQLHGPPLLNIFVTSDDPSIQHLEHRSALLFEHGSVRQQDKSLGR